MDRTWSDHEERVLVLAPAGRDAALTRRLLVEAGLIADVCEDAEALCRELDAGCGAVLLAQEALGPAALALLSEALGRQPAWSDVPITVIVGEGLMGQGRIVPPSDLLRHATYLERPVRIVTLTSALRAALAARHRQYEVRDHLAERERTAEELRQANQRLLDDDRRKDQFLALLGHELRNPLAAISNSVQLLGASPQDPDRVAHVAEIIRRQTTHLVRLVDDLLDVSRVTAGKIRLKRQPVELGELCERCRQTVAGAAEAQRHALRLLPAPGPLWVDGDAVRLEQVVVNLLMNAVKYTPPGGRIDLSLASEGGRGIVRVKDNGAGIAKEMLAQIFDLFSQAPRTLDRSQGGLGIGLTLARTLVELHDGVLSAQSDGLGRGSEFVVRLPLRAGAFPPARPPSAPRQPVTPRRIILIEDNPDLSETLQALLEAMGHDVVVVFDGHDGVARVLSDHPDVALIDIGLPGIDGYEVARQIRAALPGPLLLVAMTGYGQPEDRRRSQAAGFDAHLTKPPAMDALSRILSRGAPPS